MRKKTEETKGVKGKDGSVLLCSQCPSTYVLSGYAQAHSTFSGPPEASLERQPAHQEETTAILFWTSVEGFLRQRVSERRDNFCSDIVFVPTL